MNKVLVFILIVFLIIACQIKSEFEKELLIDNAAWNIFEKDIKKDELTYLGLMVFHSDKKWDSFMRDSPMSKEIISSINLDGAEVISRWSFNANDSIFSLGTDDYYKLISLKKDTITFQYIINDNILMLLVKETHINIPEE